MLIDATVLRRHNDECYWLFTGRRGDAHYITQAARDYAVTLTDRSQQQAVIALQGPASARILERVVGDGEIRALRYFEFKKLGLAGQDCWVARIGYSGELGYELVIDDAAAPQLLGRPARRRPGRRIAGMRLRRGRFLAYRSRPCVVYARTRGRG